MREDEEALEREKKAAAREAQQKKEREIAEMFGVPVSQARQLMTQMDPYMLQHIHQQLAAGHQIVVQGGDSDEDFEPSESGDEEASESGDGDFNESESESDEEDAFDDAADEMEEETEAATEENIEQMEEEMEP
jgi:hypothetical protein